MKMVVRRVGQTSREEQQGKRVRCDVVSTQREIKHKCTVKNVVETNRKTCPWLHIAMQRNN